MLDKVEQRIVDHVRDVGWSVMKVAPRVGSDDPQEWFAYTIGLPKTFGWPEIICFGLDVGVMHQLLNNAVGECRDKGLTPAPGLSLVEVMNDFPVRLIDGAFIADDYFGFARWFASYANTKNPPDRLQLIWPDKNGIFPDEVGCVEEIRQSQIPIETK
jgi:hypothetical protein